MTSSITFIWSLVVARNTAQHIKPLTIIFSIETETSRSLHFILNPSKMCIIRRGLIIGWKLIRASNYINFESEPWVIIVDVGEANTGKVAEME